VITIERLEYSDKAVDYIWNTLGTDYVQRTMSDQERTPSGFFQRIDRWLHGQDYYYVPLCDGEPMGLLYATDYNDFQLNGHIAILRDYWGPKALEAARKGLDQIKRDQELQQIILLIPHNNRRSRAFAERLGYRKTKTVHGIHEQNGVDVPCSFMEATEWLSH